MMRATRIAVLLALCIGTAQMASAQAWVQWTTGAGANNHYYMAVYTPDGITWDDASAAAAASGGYLAAIHSYDENQFVFSLVSDPKFWHSPDGAGNREGAWLGGYDPTRTFNWQWGNGEAWDFSYWAGGEPNYYGEEDALIYFGPGNSIQSVWNNVGRGYTSYGFVVEANSVPEPSSIAVLAGLSAMLGFIRRRR